MPLRSLCLASDVLVLRGQSQLEEFEDRFILRSPNEPDYWFGNCVIFKGAHIDPDTQIAQFRSDFPDARHVTLQWDVPNMERTAAFDAFVDRGYEVDLSDVLVLNGPLNRSAVPDGIVIRPLTSDVDWQQATELQGITGMKDRDHGPDYLPYIKTRMQVCRKQTETGFATWLGAFAGDQLVGDLGIYADARTARFQAVETRASHRRRGICAALVTAGVDWALAQYPNTKVVIVADPAGDAGRIYRRCGFELTETVIAAFKGSTGKT